MKNFKRILNVLIAMTVIGATGTTSCNPGDPLKLPIQLGDGLNCCQCCSPSGENCQCCLCS